MYQSAFSYTLTRPYPYPWFTWVVILGGIVATALFSVLNVAAYGYDTSIIYVTNPNETEYPQSLAWYQKKPWSLASKVRTFCQSTTFEIGSRFYTNNTLLQYQIDSIQIEDQNQTLYYQKSFAYHNDVFHNCLIDSMSFSIVGKDKSARSNLIDTTVVLHCTIYVAGIPTFVEMSFYETDVRGALPFMSSPANSTQSAVWWAESLLYLNGTFISTKNGSTEYVSAHRGSSTSSLDCSWTEYVQGPTGNSPLLLFDAPCDQPGGLSEPEEWVSAFGLAIFAALTDNDTGMDGESNVTNPFVYATVKQDSMIKLLYSYIMTDLGQSKRSNLFANESGVVDFLNATRPFWKTWPNDTNNLAWSQNEYINMTKLSDYTWDSSGPEDTRSFYEYMNTGVPQVNPAVINAQYLCQVPKMKPIGSLIISVIVADLVLLQALWVVFNWIVRFFMERHNSEANHCTACGNMTLEGEPLGKATSTLVPGYSAVSSQLEMRDLEPVAAHPAMRRRSVGNGSGQEVKTEPEVSVRLLSGR